MIRHPEVARRAQAEIDSVNECERLPKFEDRANLPYIECIMKEIWRRVRKFFNQNFLFTY